VVQYKKLISLFHLRRRPYEKGACECRKLTIVLDELFLHKRFDDVVIPVRICAANLRTGEEKTFTKGQLIDAVMASCAIPGFLPARKIEGEYYVDGGTLNPTPLDAYPKSSYDHFLAIDFHFHIPEKLEELGLLDTFRRSVFIGPHYAFMQRYNRYKSKCTLLSLAREDDSVFNFASCKKYMEAGEAAGEELIKAWKKSGLYDELRCR
jgi:NTE family protein